MRIKKYEAYTEQQAMVKIKDELGPDAIILSIKKSQPRGLFSFLRRVMVEVTAAYDEKYPDREALSGLDGGEARIPDLLGGAAKSPEGATVDFSVGESAEGGRVSAGPVTDEIFFKNKRIIELEEVVRGLEKKIKAGEETISKMKERLGSGEAPPRQYQSGIVQIISDTLTEQGVLPEVAAKMLEDAAEVADGGSEDIELITRIVYNAIIRALGEPDPIDSCCGTVNEVFFLGPTGVGKTTTIAKLSSSFILKNKFSVALVTADTYRIAAVEQLKTYGEILGIDVKVAYKPDDLRKSLEKLHGTSDIILIDTAGRSHRNPTNLAELRHILDTAPESRKYLVLSLATRYEDIINNIDIYSSITEFGLIFTKLDETDYLGPILNVCLLTGKRISYVTYGQTVPDDIEIVQPDKIAKALLGFGGDLF